MGSENQLSEDIRVRVPKWMKEAFARIEGKTLKKESEQAREALMQYLRDNGEVPPAERKEALAAMNEPNVHYNISPKQQQLDRLAQQRLKQTGGPAVAETNSEPPEISQREQKIYGAGTGHKSSESSAPQTGAASDSKLSSEHLTHSQLRRPAPPIQPLRPKTVRRSNAKSPSGSHPKKRS